MARIARIAAALAIAFAVFAGMSRADTIETIKVEKADRKAPKHETLRFLKDNREFLRARLDRLRVNTLRESDGSAEAIDDRYLRLAEMAAAIAAARDTVAAERDFTLQRELLESVTELGAIEDQLDLMERLLADQRARLLELESDFLERQETAMVIVLRGGQGAEVPSEVVVAEGNESVRIALTPAHREALARGGLTQIYHEFVEPRRHDLTVRFETGIDAGGAREFAVTVDAARDRLTFLELDLAMTETPSTRVWHR